MCLFIYFKGMPALLLCRVALPGHHFLSPVFVRAHKFGCSSNIHVCRPVHQVFLRASAPPFLLSKALLASFHVLGWHVKWNNSVESEFS